MSVATDTELALLVDTGTAWTKAGVIGRVRGRWRLVAHAAQPAMWGEDELMRRLVEQLAASADPRLTGRFHDLLSRATRVECRTPERAARLAVVAVSRELSGSAARRAAEAAGWHVTEMISFDDGRTLAERVALIQAAEVDAWLVAGGFDDARSARALEAAALVAAARRPGGPPVVWAGSAALSEDVRGMFEKGAATAVANPRPDARRDEPAALRTHLQALLRRTVGPEDEERLTPVALPRAVGALSAATGFRVLAVDIGATTAMRVLAEPDGTTESRVHARGGLAGARLLPSAPGRIVRTDVDAGDEPAVADLLHNLHARPASLPQTAEELAATQAATRLLLTSLLEDGTGGSLDLVIGAGRVIAAAPHPAQALRMLLDGVRPVGVTQLAVDSGALLGPLGSLTDAEISEGLALLADDLLVPLGTSVVCRGGEPGRVAMRVTLHRAGWPAHGPVEVRTGQVQVLPLPRGQEADLIIEPANGVTLGGTRRSPRITATATGGTVGVALDARGVPIGLPRRADDRRALVASWRDALMREAPPGAERVA
ncbi:MAG: glutamate mutase L [Chloroflexi bacterium]|nr:glutamate mutase L [Chloroflexota bacterium]